MKSFLISYATAFFSMLAIDAVWLSVMSKRFYTPYLGHLLADAPRFVPAGIFYVLYIFGIVFFVVSPALENGASLLKVFLSGALLGLFAYATYDLTNQATLKSWPTIVTLVDLVWGTLLTGTIAVLAVVVTKMSQ